MKNSFKVYYDWEEIIDYLSDADAGKIFKAFFDHEKGKQVELSHSLSLLFISFRQMLDRNKENYERVCEKYSDNAKKRWERIPTNAKLSKGIPPHAVAYDKDKVKDKDILTTRNSYKNKKPSSRLKDVPSSPFTPEFKDRMWEELETASAKEVSQHGR